MNLEQLAEELITLVQGDVTEVTINGVVEVFKGIMKGMNNNWESHLAKETNEVLMYDKIRCSGCDTVVQVVRTRQLVDVTC